MGRRLKCRIFSEDFDCRSEWKSVITSGSNVIKVFIDGREVGNTIAGKRLWVHFDEHGIIDSFECSTDKPA